MGIFVYVIDAGLAAFIAREVVQFVPRYKQLKQDIANGDTQARSRVYYEALAFEWISALLAVAALGFDWLKLKPQELGLESLPLLAADGASTAFERGVIGGVVAALVLGTVVFVVARLKADRRALQQAVVVAAPAPWWRKLVPDFWALTPITMRERLIWVLVAVSAGVCEEVVFRGWLLATLHSLGIGGVALILTAAVMFGLAHAYQGITGMVATGLAGAVFCALYVRTGSLMTPILLHILIDIRFAVLPGPRSQTQSAFA